MTNHQGNDQMPLFSNLVSKQRSHNSRSPRKRMVVPFILIAGTLVVGTSWLLKEPANPDHNQFHLNRVVAQQPAPQQTTPPKIDGVVRLIKLVWKAKPSSAATSLQQIRKQILDGELSAEDAKKSCSPLQANFATALEDATDPRYVEVVSLAALWHDAAAIQQAEVLVRDQNRSADDRKAALSSLRLVQPELVGKLFKDLMSAPDRVDPQWILVVIDATLATQSAEDRRAVVESIPKLPSDVSATVVERLVQRPSDAIELLQIVQKGDIRKELFNLNQIKKLLAAKQPQVDELVTKIWGQIRIDEKSDRQKAIREVSEMLGNTRGDAVAGWIPYQRVCGQCHLLHGKGNEVGPNLSQNGRGNFEQLLSNVLDPSLVIGEAYRAYTVQTTDGRVLTGLIVEESDNKLVLKIQGGQIESIDKEEIEQAKLSTQSLMPEGLESQLTRQELADLFALLTLLNAPEEKSNTILQGTPTGLHQQ